ncbi:MAG: polymerase subunit gamma and tau, partial [Pseudonocardiales bacterium]|nr:polymerase subunit gamma and tau [Pseudonocardiales bacterium]
APPAPGQLDATALRRLWPEILENVRQSSRTTWAMLDGAQITAVDGDLVAIAVAPSLAKRIAEDRNTSMISAAFTTAVGGSWRVSIEAGNGKARGSEEAPPERAAAVPSPEPDPRDDTEPQTPATRVDPEAEALRLLQDELGARPVDDQTA